jgi:TPR repeat protein
MIKRTYMLIKHFITFILLISLCLQSCDGPTKQLIPIRDEADHSQEIFPQTNIQPLFNQTLTAEGGHTVTFYKEEGKLKANLQVNHLDESDKLYKDVPVAIGKGVDLTVLSRLDKKTQQNRILILFSQEGKPTKIVVHQPRLIGEMKKVGKVKNNYKQQAQEIDDEERELTPEELRKQQRKNATLSKKHDLIVSDKEKGKKKLKRRRFTEEDSKEKEEALEAAVGDKEVQYRKGQEYETRSNDPTLAPEKKNNLAEKAIIYYTEAAEKGHEAAQESLIRLRDLGVHSCPHEVVMTEYKKAVEEAIHFDEFQKRAEERFNKLQANGQPAMRLSDFTVTDLKVNRGPLGITWGGNPNECANVCNIYGPLFKPSKFEKYEEEVMSIDPSGDGDDETAYCVAKRHGDYYFITAVGGIAGGYNNLPEDKIGYSIAVFEKLVKVALDYKVKLLYIEKNYNPAFIYFFKHYLDGTPWSYLRIKPVINSLIKKQNRIIDTLYTPLIKHRLIIDQKVLLNDFNAKTNGDLNYKFFYQLMAIKMVEKKEDSSANSTPAESKFYFIGDNPSHDDRVDAVAMAINYLVNRRDKEIKAQEYVDSLHNILDENGYIPQKLELAYIYMNGLKVKRNFARAYKIYMGYLKSKPYYIKKEVCFNLGKIYKKGWGDKLPPNEEQAFKWFQEAANQGHAIAQYKLGKIYEKKQMFQEATRWYEQAAGKAHNKALEALKKKAKEVAEPYKKEKIRVLHKKEAQLKHTIASAKYQQAYMFIYGQGVNQAKYGKAEDRYEKASILFYEAGTLGDVRAIYNVGLMYFHGTGTTQDYGNAFEHIKKAADQGHIDAKFVLGYMYYNGYVRPTDEHKAIRLYQEAANKGHKEAQHNLIYIYNRDNPIEKFDKMLSPKKIDEYTSL